jgi:hypothetical protein
MRTGARHGIQKCHQRDGDIDGKMILKWIFETRPLELDCSEQEFGYQQV